MKQLILLLLVLKEPETGEMQCLTSSTYSVASDQSENSNLLFALHYTGCSQRKHIRKKTPNEHEGVHKACPILRGDICSINSGLTF